MKGKIILFTVFCTLYYIGIKLFSKNVFKLRRHEVEKLKKFHLINKIKTLKSILPSQPSEQCVRNVVPRHLCKATNHLHHFFF